MKRGPDQSLTGCRDSPLAEALAQRRNIVRSTPFGPHFADYSLRPFLTHSKEFMLFMRSWNKDCDSGSQALAIFSF